MSDFGALQSAQPKYIAHVSHGDEVLEVFRFARAHGLPVTTRGAGHSVHGQSLSHGGISMHVYEGECDATLLPGGVETSAFTSLRALERFLNHHERRVPVLPDYLDLSLGGVLSVGGIGLNSLREGMLVDHVRKITLLTPSGSRVVCSREENSELFRLVLGGLGQLGVIERVTMTTRPAAPLALSWSKRHLNLHELLDFLGDLFDKNSNIDHYNGYIKGDEVVSEYGQLTGESPPVASRMIPSTAADRPFTAWRDFPFAMQNRRETWMSAYPQTVKMWTDYIVPFESARAFARALCGALESSVLGSAVKAIYILAVHRDPDHLRFGFTPASAPGPQVGFGLYTMIDRYQPIIIAKAARELEHLLRGAVGLGVRPYLYGYVPLDSDMRKKIYGSDLSALRRLRQRYCSGLDLNPNCVLHEQDR